MAKIEVGSAVVAVRDGGIDSQGLPLERPRARHVYRITSIYQMAYGLGCTLKGMNPQPYKGYLLNVTNPRARMSQGWYFELVEPADDEFSQTLYDYLRSRDNVPVE